MPALVFFTFSLFALTQKTSGVNLKYGYVMEFILPDRETIEGRVCAKYSDYYCFTQLAVDHPQRLGRHGHESDKNRFSDLVREKYQDLNWYSMSSIVDSDTGGCCVRQSILYVRNGQRKGLSPEQYLTQASNFSSFNKELLYVTVRYEESICANIITGLSFGNRFTGIPGVRYIGDLHWDKELLFPSGDENIRSFMANNTEELLTFDWFKFNVMCKEQPWICHTDWTTDLTSSEIQVLQSLRRNLFPPGSSP